MKLNRIFRQGTRWFWETPERALNQAYTAALKIQSLEEKHFQGDKIAANSSQYSPNVLSYFQTEVQGHLQTIKVRLAEFKASRLFMTLSPVNFSDEEIPKDSPDVIPDAKASLYLERLNFIDQITSKYQAKNAWQNGKVQSESATQSLENKTSIALNQSNSSNSSTRKRKTNSQPIPNLIDLELENQQDKLDSVTDKTGVIPRSFLSTINRIKQEIDPKSVESEAAVLNRFRSSRYKTAISIKFIMLLIIVPLLTHQLTKTFFLTPLVEKYFHQNEQIVFINKDLEEEALIELQHYEETLHFKSLIGLIPSLSSEELETEVKHKAEEISEDYRHRGTDAIANIFADLFSVGAFGIVIVTSAKEIEIVKSFLDGILYNLSDSAKAFLIILFTDMFVGFHSPHGWEVILEGIARHFGVPENREFNFLFIATFPVILDTVLKYWIFRYLNRISPSAVATYRNMNE